MIKLHIYSVILFSFIYSSSLELYGTGQRIHEIEAMGMALGNSYFFSDHSSQFNTVSIATLWRSDLTRITFSSKFSSNIGGLSDKNINISSFSFLFPVAKTKVVSIGLVPYTRSNIRLIEEGGFNFSQNSSEFIDSPLNSHSEYKFFGGISNLYTSFSMEVNKNNSFGFKLNSLFGNQIKMNKIIVSTFETSFDETTESSDYSLIEQDSTSKVILNQFSGYSLQFDWNTYVNKHQFGASVSIMGPVSVNFKKYYNIYSISDPLDRYFLMDYSYLYMESGDDLLSYDPDYSIQIEDDVDAMTLFSNIFNRINDYKLGYHYNDNDIGFIIEFHRTDLFKNYSLQVDDVSILNNQQPSTTSYHLGLYKRYDNSNANFFNGINLRAGGYYRSYALENGSATDLALTLGMGVGLNNYSNLIDLGLKIGKINNSIFDDENYIKGNLSINIGEKWFTRSRRK